MQGRAVHLQTQCGLVHLLLNVRVDGARNFLDALHHLAGERVISFDVIAGKLYVDGRRQTKVQNLRDDVGWLEKKFDAGKALRQNCAQSFDICCRRLMIGAQRNENLAIERTNGSGVAVRQVDAAVGHAQVVQNRHQLLFRDHFPDDGLDLISEACGFLDLGAGRRTHV